MQSLHSVSSRPGKARRLVRWVRVQPRGVSCNAACTCRAVISVFRPRLGNASPTASNPSLRNRARPFNIVGRPMPSVVATRLFAPPSPAGSKTLAQVAARTLRHGCAARPLRQSVPLTTTEQQGDGRDGSYPQAYYSGHQQSCHFRGIPLSLRRIWKGGECRVDCFHRVDLFGIVADAVLVGVTSGQDACSGWCAERISCSRRLRTACPWPRGGPYCAFGGSSDQRTHLRMLPVVGHNEQNVRTE